MKSDVTHLNSEVLPDRLPHEFQPLCPVPDSRSCASPNTGPLGRALRCRVSGAEFWLLPVACLHGFCPSDLARGNEGHRDVFERQADSALPLGLFRSGGQIDVARSQLAARLDAVGGYGQELDAKSPSALRGRFSHSILSQ